MNYIMIIDDEQTFIKLIGNALKKNGYKVETALNGEEGFAKIKENPPDLIVLDISMPVMDGFSFLQEIKASDKLKDIPIIVSTAREQFQGLFTMEGVPKENFLAKPYDVTILIEKIKTLIGNND